MAVRAYPRIYEALWTAKLCLHVPIATARYAYLLFGIVGGP